MKLPFIGILEEIPISNQVGIFFFTPQLVTLKMDLSMVPFVWRASHYAIWTTQLC